MRTSRQLASLSGSARRHGVAARASILLVLLAGCGGGGGAVGPAGNNPGGGVAGGGGVGGQPASAGAGTVDVVVRHAYGDPAAGVGILVYHPWGGNVGNFDGGGTTDQQGRVRLTNVPPGDLAFDAFVNHKGVELSQRRGQPVQRLADGGRIQFDVVLYPLPHDPSYGVVGTPGSAVRVGASGLTLDLMAQLLNEFDITWEGSYQILLEGCEPDPDNDVPIPTADCVRSLIHPDVGYVSDLGGKPAGSRTVAGRTPMPYDAALLVDVSRAAAVNDPAGARWYGLRYFLGTRLAATRIALGAFAADDVDTGEHRELPEEPLTLPTSPFAATDEDLHAAIEALESLQGGSTPLYAALAQMIDIVSTSVPDGGRRSIIVLTDGHDDDCGGPQTCAALRQTLIEACGRANVSIIAVGYVTPNGDRLGLDELTRETGGFTLWAEQPAQTALLLERIGQFLDGRAATRELDFRLTSATRDAFHPSAVVLGALRIQFLSIWGDAEPTTVPLRVAIP
jgi:hypothetical protein